MDLYFSMKSEKLNMSSKVIDSILIDSVDSLQLGVDQILNIQQTQSAKLDSLSAIVNQQTLMQEVGSSRVDSLLFQLNSISENGVGYSDAASHVVIPLIIALFAFAFPFLFTVITHVNNKYESDHISWMFSKEYSYKWFIRGAVISAVYLFVVALLSLCFTGGVYHVFKNVLSWLGVFVAGGYSAIILWFVLTCIRYNTPQKMVEIIERQYLNGGKEVEAYLKKLAKQEKRNEREKSEAKRHFKAMGLQVGRNFAYYNTEEARIKRLTDLGKYALRKQDYNLFLSVVMKVDELVKDSKKRDGGNDQHMTAAFYENIVEAYLFCPQNNKVEETLMMYWFAAFNRTVEPNPYLIYRMLGKIVIAMQQGRKSLFEAYMLKARIGYGFVNHLQIVSFVRGRDVAEQQQIDKSRLVFWAELCEMHFMALAHLFSTGNIEAVKIVLTSQAMGYGKLLPASGTDVLKMYARCKEKQQEDGRFGGFWYLKEVIGENPDPDLLEKLTALLLLVASDNSYKSMNLISQDRMQLIRNAEDKLVRYGDSWTKTYNVYERFPEIGDKDVRELFDEYVKQLEEGVNVEKKHKNIDIFMSWFYAFIKVLMGERYVKKDENIYEKKVPENIKDEVRIMFGNILYGNKGYIEDSLIGKVTDNKTEKKQMGSLSFMVYKHALMDSDGLYSGHVFNDMLNIFRSRYQYMIYQFLGEATISEETIPMDEFDASFMKYVGENGKDYLIIDTDASISTFYKMDELEDGRKFSFNRTYKGADYHHYDSLSNWYLKDVPELCAYDGTVVIIRKNDMPILAGIDDTDGPEVDFNDKSDEKEGIAAVSLTVNTNYEVCYSANVKVKLLRILRRSR